MSLIDDPVIWVVPGDLHWTEAGLENHLAAIGMIEKIDCVINGSGGCHPSDVSQRPSHVRLSGWPDDTELTFFIIF